MANHKRKTLNLATTALVEAANLLFTLQKAKTAKAKVEALSRVSMLAYWALTRHGGESFVIGWEKDSHQSPVWCAACDKRACSRKWQPTRCQKNCICHLLT